MARIEWVEHRLQNWANWLLGGGAHGSMGYAHVSFTSTPGRRDYGTDTVVPVNAVEAAETDDAVQKLNPPGLGLTLREFYAGHGGISDKARRLSCSVATVYARVDQAHAKLAAYWLDLEARRREARQRVEALQASARGGGFTT